MHSLSDQKILGSIPKQGGFFFFPGSSNIGNHTASGKKVPGAVSGKSKDSETRCSSPLPHSAMTWNCEVTKLFKLLFHGGIFSWLT